MRISEILNEMIIRRGNRYDLNGKTLIAFDANIWILDAHEEDVSDICKKTGLKPCDDLQDIEDQIKDYRPDIFLAYIHDNKLNMDGSSLTHDPRSSPLIRKIIQYLDLDGTNLSVHDHDGNEDEVSVSYSDSKGDIPEIVYHGTSSLHIRNILNTGIRPTDNANYKNIAKFRELIFLTASSQYANYQADRQANTHSSCAIIIATKIPDRSKITMDYDVAAQFYGDSPKTADHYIDVIHQRSHRLKDAEVVQNFNPKRDFTKATGVFGYRGAIRPSFFQNISVTFGEEDDKTTYDFNNKQELLKALEMFEDLGYYDPDYDPSEDEEE